MESSTLNWAYVQALLNAQAAIPKQQKSGGAVEYWREWDADRHCAVWVKTYRNSGKFQLDAFNQAEIEILMQLAAHKVPNTYRSALIERVGTQLGQVGRDTNAGAQYTIKTKDAGATLDDWLRAPVARHLSGGTRAHVLVEPENFLLLAQTLLSVFDGVHANNYIHCDVHPGNISLPSRLVQQSAQTMHVELLWDQLTCIDFGYSINRHNPPRTTLPFQRKGPGTRISPHLANCLAEIEVQTMSFLEGGQDAHHWADVYLDPAFWQRWQGTSPLERFKTLDWREDLYQLGCMLADIRDGVGMASHLEGCTIQSSPVAAVNQLIDELPQQLKAWGQHAGSSAPAQPHQEYVSQIGKVLGAARQKGHVFHSSYVLRQADYASAAQASRPEPIPQKTTPLVARPLPAKPLAVATSHIARPLASSTLDLPTVVPVPAGSFVMGSAQSADCQPLHAVQVQPPPGCVLTVGQTAITCAQWASARKLNAQLCAVQPDMPAQTCTPLHPMVNISWTDCMAYLDTLNFAADLHRQPAHLQYRLLSEAEWEYVARAGTTEAAHGRYWWGHQAPASVDKLQPVLEGKPNPWGLVGMAGHVWEWVADQHHPDYHNAPCDGTAWCDSATATTAWRQVRGASWATTPAPHGLAARTAHATNWRSPFIGLRIARWVPMEQLNNHFAELK